MNKDIFWMISIFIISLNVFLFLNYHNFLVLSAFFLLSAAFVGSKFKKIFLENKKKGQENQHQEYILGHDKVDLLIILVGLSLFILSIIFSEYEIELLFAAAMLAIVQTIRTSWIKKKKNP